MCCGRGVDRAVERDDRGCTQLAEGRDCAQAALPQGGWAVRHHPGGCPLPGHQTEVEVSMGAVQLASEAEEMESSRGLAKVVVVEVGRV
jgi:hypothetical protein